MCSVGAALITQGAMQAGGSIYGAYSAVQQGKMQQSYYNMLAERSAAQQGLNTEYANLQIEQGRKQIAQEGANVYEQSQKKERQVIGTQTAQLAASGVTGDLAERIKRQAQDAADEDQLAIIYNAESKQRALETSVRTNLAFQNMQEAFQESEYKMMGESARRAGKLQALGNLLEGSGKVAGTVGEYYYKSGKRQAPAQQPTPAKSSGKT